MDREEFEKTISVKEVEKAGSNQQRRSSSKAFNALMDLYEQLDLKKLKDTNTNNFLVQTKEGKNMFINSEEFRHYLAFKLGYTNKAEHENLMQRMMYSFTTEAEEIKVYPRVFTHPGGYTLYFAGGVENKVYRLIDGEILESNVEDMKYFINRDSTLAQIEPDVNADIQDVYKLFKYGNVEKRFQPIIISSIITMLCTSDRLSYPIINIFGPKGSGKSTFARFIKTIVDPTVYGEGLRMSESEDDLTIALKEEWLSYFDNVEKIKKSLNATLSLAATGGAMLKRKLYADDTAHVVKIRKPMIITAVKQEFMREDLLSRSILIDVMPLERTVDEMEIESGFNKDLPKILGGFLKIVANLGRYENDGSGDLIRLSGMHVISRKVGKIMGWEDGHIDTLLWENTQTQEEESVDNSLCAEALFKYFEAKHPMSEVIEFAMGEFNEWCSINHMTYHRHSDSTVKKGQDLSAISSSLSAVGWHVEKMKKQKMVNGKRTRAWVFTKIGEK